MSNDENNNSSSSNNNINNVKSWIRRVMYTFYKDVLMGYDAEYFKENDELLAHLIIDAIRFIPLEHEDEQCEFLMGLRVSPDLLLALIDEGQSSNTLCIGTKWVLRLAWAYAKGPTKFPDNISSCNEHDDMFNEFIGYISILFNGDMLLITEDSEYLTLRLIIYSLYDHLIGLSSGKIMEYVGILFYNIINHMTTPQFSLLSKMIRVYDHCYKQKNGQDEFNLNVKELIRALINASGRDLTFIDFEGTFEDMRKDFEKIYLSFDEIENIKLLITRNTPLSKKTGKVSNEYEKDKRLSPSNKRCNSHSSSSNKPDKRRGLPTMSIRDSGTDDDSSNEENSGNENDSDFSNHSGNSSSTSSNSESNSSNDSSNESVNSPRKRKKKDNKKR